MSRRLVRLCSGVFLFGLVAAGGAFGWGYAQFTRPGPTAVDRTVLLAKGSSLQDIAESLAVAGVIEHPLVFRIGVRMGGWARGLRAGEFRFPAQISMRGAMEILRMGVTVVHRLTIPEGLSSGQVVALLSQTQGLRGDLAALPAEGTLLPETYHYSYGDERAVLLARMTEAMNTTLATLWPARDQDLPFANPEQALILAAIVEKETSLPAERPRIAGVFINRLRRGMRLQSDPTVVYGLTGGGKPLGRALRLDDLDRYTPYNTYRIAGLPPGPIANPGRAAIDAVLHPMVSNELYFVADGTGGHAFATTFAQHRRNVARWRRAKAAREP
ncbi:MAG: endolytic transglycosylase MltG [Proteobacteria bacterium]|nr:endolytic transglycosylase MltG [Pseudomonadota bacterium]